jgi:hypothetical protein
VAEQQIIAGKTVTQWQEHARRDDCFSSMVPSDLRLILAALAKANQDRDAVLDEAAITRPPRSAGRPPNGNWGTSWYQPGWDDAVIAYARAIEGLKSGAQPDLPEPDPLVEKAKRLYNHTVDNDPLIHSNRFLSWEELSPEIQATWVKTAEAQL